MGERENGAEQVEARARMALFRGSFKRPSIGFDPPALRVFKRISPSVGVRLIRAALVVAYTTPRGRNVTFTASSRGFVLDCRFDWRAALLIVRAIRIGRPPSPSGRGPG